ncbi:KinB-signaling pathway activation protein [Oceanobacillus sp. CFH 90083]|uniref:KinB-signaling pathway activation protein n=1 Tax=Oceanobacillus sp. CFH 90083 TaxID=2592336 RepID=UPI00128DF571|nr:KinB-signaling pathway activation protein [Oceanobacillus sp. CFH 90083]
MNTKILVNFFWKAFWLGGLAGLIASFFIRPEEYLTYMSPFDLLELLGVFLFFLVLGLTFAAISMTGFFAYLFVNRMGLNLFKGYWPLVQVGLIVFILFDLIYFPYRAAGGDVAIYWFILIAAAMLVIGWIVAKLKTKETNSTAFIPALFFMIVFTTVEWVPGLMVDGTDYAWLMVIPLLVCNTYQILTLHRLPFVEKERKQEQKSVSKSRKKQAKKA